MAINTADKRAAAAAVSGRPILPFPDGTVTDLDRGMLSRYYGTAAADTGSWVADTPLIPRSYTVGGTATGVGRVLLRGR